MLRGQGPALAYEGSDKSRPGRFRLGIWIPFRLAFRLEHGMTSTMETPASIPSVSRVAAVQLCSGPDPADNLEKALASIETAVDGGAQLIMLPENTLYLRLDNTETAPILFPDSSEFEALKQAARRHQVWLLIGSLTEDSGDAARPFNTCVLVDDKGEISATYRKIHLFSLNAGKPSDIDEADTIAPGDTLVMAKSPFGPIGLSICYDLRFPEVYRALAMAGATILAVPSAFTERTGKVHWKPLLQTRAIENQAFVIAPGQTGQHGENRRSYGHSLILDPWGTVLAEAGPEPEVIWADLDMDALRRIRTYVPSLKDVRVLPVMTVSVQGTTDGT
ncbi:MAG: hypothetical protein CMH54_02180 [Myxococcales bacterium]|nr:hypothetical protein [Myxococcales bacterium]